ncbi:MAG TPA: non-homologous end-joining DNA ligase, partial [Kineosporiaceae bacterium]|nr:non-homologous end-joining DNA ligase [Kineosporiaceae bacterium]
DGVRAVAYVDDGPLRLMTRNDREVAVSYPELHGLPGAVAPRRVVLDGEIAAFDQQGRTSFGRLQERMHVRDPGSARRLAQMVPVTYLVFDVLHLDGESTLDRPYVERRGLLAGLGLAGVSWQVPPWFRGGGQDVFAASREQRMEGIVAKRLDSRYRPGARASEWRKVKNLRTQEVVIAGWRRGKGRREGMIGALVLAINGPDGLQHVGGVGTGFTDAALRRLAVDMEPLARSQSPFRARLAAADVRDVEWVEPVLVGEVEFAEWTGDGHLRHPSWRGLRPDKSPDAVVRQT